MHQRLWYCALVLSLAIPARGEDWPEWRGKGRTGVWNETGILETFPKDGLKVRWRTPLRGGYAGPSVADGRVFVTDFTPTQTNKGTERALCLDEKTGKVLWTREWETDYTGLNYNVGPRATPTVDGDRVYTLGAMGALHCLNARTGEVLWKKDYVKEYRTQVPVWGITGAPIVDGPRLIALVGGENNAKVVVFDKMTGKELWRALSSDWEPGYCQPFLTGSGAARQLVIWHPAALSSLNPETGAVYWEQPFKIHMGMTLATPVVSASRLLVSSFYNGSMMVELSAEKPAARMLWKGTSDSEIKTDGLHSVVSTPAMVGDYVYGICSYGKLRCLNAKTGARVWETLQATVEEARWSSGFLVRHGERFFINNDRGELIIADLSPEGYREISRTKLIKPTTKVGNRRELGGVNWSHPAYANRHIFARNDEEIFSASLEK
ncbi:MAG: PQQ-binding-like beta-propeller repeat protein [Bryobacteraceae bacterium]